MATPNAYEHYVSTYREPIEARRRAEARSFRAKVAAGVLAAVGVVGYTIADEYHESHYRENIDKATVGVLGAIANDVNIPLGGAVINSKDMTVKELKADNALALKDLDNKFEWLGVEVPEGSNLLHIFGDHYRHNDRYDDDLIMAEAIILSTLHENPQAVTPDVADKLLGQINEIEYNYNDDAVAGAHQYSPDLFKYDEAQSLLYAAEDLLVKNTHGILEIPGGE